jgi:prepilin signal peptidase PulO-like enzyme (type II secretory pathway)
VLSLLEQLYIPQTGPEAWLALTWVAFLGGAIGSFLNVVVYRLPRGLSLSHPGSACPNCKHAIRWYDNIPVLGWLKLGGKCRDCKTPISIRYPIIEAVVAVMFVAIARNEISFLEWLFLAILVAALLAWMLIYWDGNFPPNRFCWAVLLFRFVLPEAWITTPAADGQLPSADWPAAYGLKLIVSLEAALLTTIAWVIVKGVAVALRREVTPLFSLILPCAVVGLYLKSPGLVCVAAAAIAFIVAGLSGATPLRCGRALATVLFITVAASVCFPCSACHVAGLGRIAGLDKIIVRAIRWSEELAVRLFG